MKGGQETAAPIGSAAARALRAGTEHNIGGQIRGLAAKSVSDPRSHAGTAKLLRARVHENLPGRMIESVGVHGFDDGNNVRDFSEVGQQFGKLRPGLAMSRELEFWTQECGTGIDESGAIAFH